MLPPWRMSKERRDEGLGDQPESPGPDSGEKRLEESFKAEIPTGVVMEEEREDARFRPWAWREGEAGARGIGKDTGDGGGETTGLLLDVGSEEAKPE